MPQPVLPLVLLPSPKDAFRAVKKRIVGNKNFHEVMLALTVSAPSLHPRRDHSPLGAQQDSQPPWGYSFKGCGQPSRHCPVYTAGQRGVAREAIWKSSL